MQIQTQVSGAVSLQPFASQPGVINEEELSAAVTSSLLQSHSPTLNEAFKSGYEAALLSGSSSEDAVKQSLEQLVRSGVLESDTAEKIYGISFRAAQLDENHSALYDSRGSANDPTVAVASIEDAFSLAQAALNAIENGSLRIEARSLSTPTNSAPQSVSSLGGGGGEFLWKPGSESDGNLVVLLPSQLTGQIESTSLYSQLPPSPESRIEQGRFTGDTHNGGRAHFRFSQPGGNYPDGSYIVATLFDGRSVAFQIGESSSRNIQ